MLNELVNWFPSSCYAGCVHCSVMCRYVSNMFREVCLQIRKEINCFCCIVATTCCKESRQPPFPVTDNLRPVLPPDGFSEVYVHEHMMQETSVKAVDWVSVCGEYEYIRHDLVSNTAQPLLGGLMRYLIRRCLYVKYRHDARLELGLN